MSILKPPCCMNLSSLLSKLYINYPDLIPRKIKLLSNHWVNVETKFNS